MTNTTAAAMNYQTPFGSFSTWEAAAARCEAADMDPVECVVYVPTGVVG